MFSAKDTSSVDHPTNERDAAEPQSFRFRAVLLATSLALIAALTTYAVARGVSGDLIVNGPDGETAVPVGAVVFATVLAGLGAWGLAALAGRTPRPRPFLAGLLGLGLVLSTVPPVSGATTATTAAWLLLMHIVVAVPLVGLVWRLVRRSS
jgi:hypothetical protein